MNLRPQVVTTIKSQDGFVGILGILIYSAVILVIGSTMVTTSLISYKISGDRVASTQSVYHAESGAEDALMQVKRNANYGSSSTSLTTTFDARNRTETTVDSPNVNGCTPARRILASGFTGDLVRRVELTNCATPSPNIDFAYALQAGFGGITMFNNSNINGTTYTNGNHTGGNNTAVSGDVFVAGAPAATATPQYDPATIGDFVFGNLSTRTDAAQSFVADTTNSSKLIKVSLNIKKVGAPANATVRIVTNNNGSPSSTQVASGSLSASTVGTSGYGFIDISMSAPPTLTSGQRYWIVFDAPSTNASNYWSWASAEGFADGEAKYSPQWLSNGSMTWTVANTDLAFKAFMGGQPTYAQSLGIGGSAHANTLTNNTITKDAYYQTSTGNTIGGVSYPGSTDPPTRDLSVTESNINDFKAQAAGTEYNGNYTVPINSTVTLGPVKINGDLLIDNNASINMKGTIYVTGNITFQNNNEIILDPGYNADSGAIVADGSITLSNNVSVSSSGGGFLMLVTSKVGANALTVSNNATGLILAAPKGDLVVQNNGSANALVAEKLILNNNATVNYVTGLADVQFSAGPGAAFGVKGWREVLLN